MTLDWSLPVWTTIPLAIWLVACLRVHGDLRARITRIEARVDRVERML